MPWPLHAPGHAGVAQSWPSQPSSHLHAPGAAQLPCDEQLCAQSGAAQSAPPQPSKHSHWPAPLQTPWPEQPPAPPGHAASEQSLPPHPASQRQTPANAHWPWPEQLAGHVGPTSHLGPDQPGEHLHAPHEHVPWAPQSPHTVASSRRTRSASPPATVAAVAGSRWSACGGICVVDTATSGAPVAYDAEGTEGAAATT